MEDAILSAIAAMNEPKTCSTTALKKYILENHPGTNSNFQGKVSICLTLLFYMLKESPAAADVSVHHLSAIPLSLLGK